MRVGENFVSGGGVEGSAFGVLDARIEIERSFFGATRVFDAIGAGKRVDVFVVEIEIAFKLAELISRGNSTEGIFGGDLRELERGAHHAVETGFGEIGGVGAGGALSEEDADSDGFGAGFFQGFDLAEADERGEFVAFADYAFGGSGSAFHGAGDDVLGDVFQVGFGFSAFRFEFSWGHRKSFNHRGHGGAQRKNGFLASLGMTRSEANRLGAAEAAPFQRYLLHEAAGVFSGGAAYGQAIDF